MTKKKEYGGANERLEHVPVEIRRDGYDQSHISKLQFDRRSRGQRVWLPHYQFSICDNTGLSGSQWGWLQDVGVFLQGVTLTGNVNRELGLVENCWAFESFTGESWGRWRFPPRLWMVTNVRMYVWNHVAIRNQQNVLPKYVRTYKEFDMATLCITSDSKTMDDK